MANESRNFDPGAVAANRSRMQGAGVGQREMDAQRDPNRAQSAIAPDRPEPLDDDRQPEATRDRDDATRSTAQTLPDAPFLGTPANIDPNDFEDGDSPQLDWGEPIEGATHGQNHTRRPVKTEAERGQGLKTRRRNKEIVSGKPFAR